MNPELPQVRPSSEAMPQIPGGAEYFPDGNVQTPEVGPSPSIERPAQAEQAPGANQAPIAGVAAADIAMPQVPVPAVPVTPVADPVQQASDTPVVAGDDDLIEKEWVDKVKKIITLTKGSPYDQAKAIATLQADYLKKRYNRSIGESDQQTG